MKLSWVYGSKRGLEANLDMIQAILCMKPPLSIKEVQCLDGRVVTLNRFVFMAIDKCLPFLKVIKNVFGWTDDCQGSFQEF